MKEDIGLKIKQLRTNKNRTLKDLSEKTNLLIGFLSQLERWVTSIATDTLQTIAEVFDIELYYFFLKPRAKNKQVVRSYEKEVYNVYTFGCIQYNLSNNLDGKQMLPRLVEILPNNSDEDIQSYSHEGVDLSGGEVMAQDIDCIGSIVLACKNKGINVAIDTCGYAKFDNYERIISYVDLYLYDIKLIDSEKHKKFTGKNNDLILENLKKLSEKMQI